MKIVERVCAILESMGATYALAGGRAVSVRGYPRMTIDYDLFTTDRRVLQPEIWSELEEIGAIVDPRKGDFDDPLAGVVHIRLPDRSEVDVVVGRWKWQQQVIERAERLDVGGINLPVPRTSDLILLKLAAGGVLDLQDVVALLAVSDRESVILDVEEHLHDLGADAAAAWERLRR